jgi:hypothetical protein
VAAGRVLAAGVQSAGRLRQLLSLP